MAGALGARADVLAEAGLHLLRQRPPRKDDSAARGPFNVIFQRIATGESKTLQVSHETEYEEQKHGVALIFGLDLARLEVFFVPPLCDLQQVSGPTSYSAQVAVDSQAVWDAVLADCPWSEGTLRGAVLHGVLGMLANPDPSVRQEGMHRAWELAANKANHAAFTADFLGALLQALELGGSPGASSKVCLYALATAWSLCTTTLLRRWLLELGAMERLLALLSALLQGPTVRGAEAEDVGVLLRGYSAGLFSLLLCDAQARARMYCPEPQASLPPVEGTSGWGALFALLQVPAEESPAAGVQIQELGMEGVCQIVSRDPLGQKLFARKGGVSRLLQTLKSDSPHLLHCAIAALEHFTRRSSARALLQHKCSVEEVLSAAVSLLRRLVGSFKAHKKTAGNLQPVAESAAHVLSGTARAALEQGVVVSVEALRGVLGVVEEAVGVPCLQSALLEMAACLPILAASKPIARNLLAAGLLESVARLGGEAAAAEVVAAAMGALALVAEHEGLVGDAAALNGGGSACAELAEQMMGMCLKAQHRFPSHGPLTTTAAASLMYLAGYCHETPDPELEGVLALVKSECAESGAYAAAAVWSLARSDHNRVALGRLGALQVLVGVGEAAMSAVPNADGEGGRMVTKRLEFVLAAIWMLLTLDTNLPLLESTRAPAKKSDFFGGEPEEEAEPGQPVGGLVLLVGVVKGGAPLQGPQWDSCKQLAVHALFAATANMHAFERKAIELGIGPALGAIAVDPSASTGLRPIACHYFQVLAGVGQAVGGGGGGGGLEEMLVSLMRSGEEALEERGARGAAHVALYRENKHRLAKAGAVPALLALADKSDSQAVVELALAALLNLSTSPENQVAICAEGLYVVLKANRAPHNTAAAYHHSSALLENLARHPANRTRVYKAELRVKAHDLDLYPPPLLSALPPPEPSPKQKTGAREGVDVALENGGSNVKLRFMEWMEDTWGGEEGPQREATGGRNRKPRISEDDRHLVATLTRKGALSGRKGAAVVPEDREAGAATSARTSRPSLPAIQAGRQGSHAEAGPGPLSSTWGATTTTSPTKARAAETLPALAQSLRGRVASMWQEGGGASPTAPKSTGSSPRRRGKRKGTKGGAQSSLPNSPTRLVVDHWHPPIKGYRVVQKAGGGGCEGEERPPSPPSQFLNSPQALQQLTVVLEPDRARNHVHFERAHERAHACDSPSATAGHLDVFLHQEGSAFCGSLFKHYRLPSGELAHYYQSRKAVVDEVEVPLEPAPEPPVSLESIFQSGLPGPVVCLHDGAAWNAERSRTPFTPPPRAPPLPPRHTLLVRPHLCPDNDASKCPRHGDLAITTPLFLIEGPAYTPPPPPPKEEEVKPPEPPVAVWDVNASVFAPRKRETDNRSLYHSKALEDAMLECDWARVTSKTRFIATIGSASEVAATKAALRAFYTPIIQLYGFFGSLGTGDTFSLQLNEWTALLQTAKIPDGESARCKLKDCDRIFITSNYEYDKKAEESLLNDDHSLLRFELLEALVRIAVAKYGGGICTKSTAEAVRLLLEENVAANLPPEARIDFNDFRERRLYTQHMDQLYTKHIELLRGLFSFFKAPNKGNLPGKYLEIQHWMEFVARMGLLEAAYCKLSVRDARLIYVFGRAMVANELKDRVRATSATFVDFLEMVGRVADLLCLPSDAELSGLGLVGDSKLYQYVQLVSSGKPPLPPGDALVERPLHEKAAQLLEIVIGKCLDLFEAKDLDQLLKKITAAVKR